MNNHQNHIVKAHSPTLKSKTFHKRNSLITELLKAENFVTVKCMFYAILLGFVGNDLVCGLIFGKDVHYGLRLIKIGFKRFDITILISLALFFGHTLTFYLFKLWANVRQNLMPRSIIMTVWDYIFLLSFLIYYVGGAAATALFTKNLDIGVLSKLVIIAEQVGLTMKIHSFIRYNVPVVKSYKPHSDQKLSLPKLIQYIYFSFAPTFIYQKEYPRTEHIDNAYAVQCFIEVFAVIWLQSFVFDIFFVRNFESAGLEKIYWSDIYSLIMHNTVGGFIMLISVFYQFLDRWLNGSSEILQFADRKFYEDWWTSTNYSIYFRKYNIVVQDWLFEYVYKEFYENIVPNNRRIAQLMVFFISAVVHEYILIFMLDMFFPLLFFNFFVLGQLMAKFYVNSKHPFFNMGILYSLSLGNSIQLSLYTMEFHARQYCTDNSSWSYFKPRIFTSDCIN